MLKAFVSGIFPRQDELIGAINRFEKKRISFEELEKIFRRCEEEWLDLQKGLTIVSEPSLGWNDIFRPFTLNIKNLEAGPLTRYLETNTFYRRPIFSDYPVKENSVLEQKNEYGLPFYIRSDSKVILPGPYTFVKSGEYPSNLDERRLVEKMAEIVFDEASNFNYIEFKEPLVQDLNILKGLENIYSTFSGNGYISTGIRQKSYLDFSLPYTINTYIENPPENIILGIIDVFSTKIEDFQNIEDNVTITTNESLEFLPFRIAKEKVLAIRKLLGVK
jgi:5-methyltetrahydropteroyltriglutamate--homocysteine methyltransferase